MAVRPAKSLAHRLIEGQAFVLEPRARRLHSLNAVGSRIWQLLGLGRPPEIIAERLIEEFEVGLPKAREDVARFLSRLQAMGLLEEP